MTDGRTIAICASVFTEDHEEAAKAAEALARVAAGLVLDGIDVSVNMHRLTDEEDDL